MSYMYNKKYMIGIYKITNPKGKVYIGQSINMKKRINQYKNKQIKKQPRIYNSIQKYGWDNHIFEIIEECPIELLHEREVYWKQLILDNNGGRWESVLFCNLYDTGSKGPLSDHIKNKIKGTKRTIETKQKMRDQKLGKPSNFKGYSHSLLTKEKMKNNKLGKPSNNKKIKIFQYDLNNNFIQEWECIGEIKKQLNFNKTSIINCCKGIQKTAYNFVWGYK